jgi:hypothetical protein
MSLAPAGWGVVLVGKWNKAILSPKGIAQHLFKLPADTKIQVNVPLDGVSAYLVRNPEETLSVHVETERLQIDLLKCSYEILDKGMKVGVDALEMLPITPISAVGFNVNFKSPEVPVDLLQAIECTIDSKIALNGMELAGRSLGRTIRFNDGVINLSVRWTGEEYQINCNFHLDTADVTKAKEWLRTPMDSIKERIQIISVILGVELNEGSHDENQNG